jgi:hypothetical protein
VCNNAQVAFCNSAIGQNRLKEKDGLMFAETWGFLVNHCMDLLLINTTIWSPAWSCPSVIVTQSTVNNVAAEESQPQGKQKEKYKLAFTTV